MVLRLLALGLIAACAHAPSPEPVAARGALTLAVVVDGSAGAEDAPAAVTEALAGVLGGYGFQVTTQPCGSLGPDRSSAARLRALAARVQTPHVALIELKVRYLSPSAGRFRWQVGARFRLARALSPERATADQTAVPAILERVNQDSEEALEAALPSLERALGRTAERFTAGLASGLGSDAARILYLVLVDRFADGPDAARADEDTDDPQGWHGGDLDGLRQRLDAIAGLGVTDLWLTPLAPGRSQSFDGHGAFHGYWVHRPDEVAERFGGIDAARRLRRALSRRGMRLMLDLVTNHVAWDAPLRAEHPTWFTPDRAITDWDDPDQVERGWVHGLPDLNQRLPAVREHLIRASKALVEALQPDALRLDAVRHQSSSFLRQLVTALGPVETAGEVFDGRPDVVAETQNSSGISHVFDFPMYYAMSASFCADKPMSELAVTLSDDRLYNDPSRLITFLDNHDTERLASRCGGDPARIAQALGFLTALRGLPMITYGTERGLDGAAEPLNRADMTFDPHPSYALLRQLIRRRHNSPALAWGSTDILSVASDHIALLRHARGDTRLVLSWRGTAPRLADILPSGFSAAGEASGERGTVVRSISVSAERFAIWQLAHRAPRRVLITGDDPKLVVAGSGPELHHWRPRQAAAIGPAGLQVSVPGGLVLAYKLARRGERGLTYESGANRILSTLPTGDRSVAVIWRP
jgi:alpha-amylase